MTIDRKPPMEFIAAYIVPAIFLMTGIILLCAGGRLLKPAIGLSFGLLGAGSGLLIAPNLSIGISPLIIALTLGIIAAILAVYLAKLAILLILALSFAIATPVVTWQFADLGDGKQVVEDVVEAVTTTNQQSTEDDSVTTFTSTENTIIQTVTMVTEDIQSIASSGIQRANKVWEIIPTGSRLILVGSAIAGLLLGLLIATFMPYFSSVLVSSVAGSFVLIQGVRTIATMIWSSNQMSSVTPELLIGATVVLALAGIGLQLTLTRKSKAVKQAD